ncbi:hypothetical protein ACFQ1S_24020 [Kibdelosporangium lantanae]|uniref:Uncharacterized protein n=1 Tax=Kibdelosporangium lantanae TaxID=1497396 RepID=A0ABW3MEG3_9PSEU
MAASPPSNSHTTNPPGTDATLHAETTYAPTAPKVNWHNEIIPALPVTTPNPSNEIAATTTLIPRYTKYPASPTLNA